MLKTAGHKGGNGQQNAHDLIDHGLAGSADPYGQADKDVAQNAAEEDGNGVDRNLTGGDAHHGVGDGLAVELVNSCHVNQKDNEQGAGKIADPHNSPSLEHLDERDLVALKRADHKRVAGKQLRAANKHEHQPQAKSKATYKALSAPAKGRIAQKDREEQAAKGDERTGEHSEQKGLRDRQVSLGNAGGLSLGLDRGGRQAIGGGIFCLEICHVSHFFPNQQGRALPMQRPRVGRSKQNRSEVNVPLTCKLLGAGDGNRTRVISLEGWGSTIELRPQDMVGTTGFEPATSCSQSRRATKLRHVPKVLSS